LSHDLLSGGKKAELRPGGLRFSSSPHLTQRCLIQAMVAPILHTGFGWHRFCMIPPERQS
jgi:hypothetical protein